MRIIQDDSPDDPRHFIPYVEFYITNVCNLTCTNCNRFNDFNFSGWQNWNDYKDDYTEWAKHVRLQSVTILGGEPLLNPSLLDWVTGINQLWQKNVQILTNGTRLNKVKGLYEILLKNNDPLAPGMKNWVGVSLHNPNDRDRCFDEIKKFLKGNIKYVHKDDPLNVNCCYTFGGDHAFIDENGVRICVWEYLDFYPSAVHKNAQGRFTVFNNDPIEAHSKCGFAQYKCYHFIRGNLYKCGPVALFPEFDQQHIFDISDSDRQIMHSYTPLTAYEFEEKGKEFFKTIDSAIPQCKFCPTEMLHTQLFAVTKKDKSISGFE